jgi:hypothetical protein
VARIYHMPPSIIEWRDQCALVDPNARKDRRPLALAGHAGPHGRAACGPIHRGFPLGPLAVECWLLAAVAECRASGY